MDAERIYESVLDRYTAAAHGGNASHSHTVAKAFGYTEAELARIPKDANLGLCCGFSVVLACLFVVFLSCFLKYACVPTVLILRTSRERRSSISAVVLDSMSSWLLIRSGLRVMFTVLI